MTSRRVLALDRFAAALIALALVAAGGAVVWWWTGRSPLPVTTDAGPARDVVAAAWFPWVSALAGVLLVLLALRWIAAHRPRGRMRDLTMSGSDSTGRLTIDGSRATKAAAGVLADTVGVRSATGAVRTDRGRLVATIRAVIEPEADLGTVSTRASQVSGDLGTVLGRRDLRCGVTLAVPRRGRAVRRLD